MSRFPFSVYDFFGYIASGVLLLATVEYILGKQWVSRDEKGVLFGLFWIILAYVIGQVLANPSAWLLERVLVEKWLNRPNINLFENPPKMWWAKIFPGYLRSLPLQVRKSVIEKAKAEGITETGETLFIHAFTKVKSDKDTMARLDSFLNLYGFCRNISFTCLIAALIILIGSWNEGTLDKLIWFFLAIIGSVGMFYRYLKFFRQYSYELFITYAALSSNES